METYKIIRGYCYDETRKETIKTGLTLEEAREHCRSKETSSRTSFSKEGAARTAEFGPWFDGYTSE